MGFFESQTCTAFILNDRVRTFNVRLKNPVEDNLKKLNDFVKSTYPDLALEFATYQEIRQEQNASVSAFRNTVWVTTGSVSAFRNTVWVTTGCIILIVLMGLIGYVSDETQRRSKEIAIRKVNGAEAGNILGMLSIDILKPQSKRCRSRQHPGYAFDRYPEDSCRSRSGRYGIRLVRLRSVDAAVCRQSIALSLVVYPSCPPAVNADSNSSSLQSMAHRQRESGSEHQERITPFSG